MIERIAADPDVHPPLSHRQRRLAPSYIGVMDLHDLAETYLDILRTGELGRLDDLLAEDVYDHVGQRSGIAWWKEILAKVGAGGHDDETVLEHVIAEGDLVAFHIVVKGHQTAGFLPQLGPVEATGLPYSWRQVHIFRAANGKVVEHWAVRDDLGRAKQVGAL